MNTAPHGRGVRILLVIAGSLLLLLAVLYFAKGLRDLMTATYSAGHAIDLRNRWTEQQYIFRGKDPYDIYFSNPNPEDFHTKVVVIHPTPNDPSFNRLGCSPNYPPWYYGWASLIFWPKSWAFARILYLLLTVASVSLIGFWIWQELAGKRLESRFFLWAGSMALSSYATCLNDGQLGILATAALCGAYLLQKSGRSPVLIGLFVSWALGKPSMAAFNPLIFLIRREIWALFFCLFFVSLGSAVTWWLTSIPPWQMLFQMLAGASTEVRIRGTDWIHAIVAAGFDPQHVTLVFLLGGFVAAAFLLWKFSHDLLVQYAIVCVVHRIAFHHMLWDNVMLVFLLVALARVALDPFRLSAFLGWALVAVSLWLPGWVFTHLLWTESIQILCWVIGLWILLANSASNLAPLPVTREPMVPSPS